ncbi:hypothetical protein TraAM80_03973 [Trypanosoma rangeli]|uniref:Treble clef zinc finger domain-containing protein n=1 Tax=Trypanosoma rangeli TaxID=5698 RepID=A0A3R7NRE8_TRYRA|nr:uncharacterized protein TraAM80_03973 [Trypanosoma rangeli]RNF06555.1 hypothetical protein TraAM80_03973 [Trypanosoma rangeli]|eukprot:RNF06555.1 hypothetical protein TraAM80_03973 [Trypanosoma rangeli]
MYWRGAVTSFVRGMSRHRHRACEKVTLGVDVRTFYTVTPLLMGQCAQKVKFSLDALPPNLQQEFCCEENARNLRHMLTRPLGTAASSAERVINVLPSWVHVVAWQCNACGCHWSARPVDRTDPQVSSFYACPQCVSGASLERTSSSHLPRPCVRRLAEVHPLLAAQWDECRNAVIHNRVFFESVADVPLPCSTVVWWACPHCQRSWKESVDSRVHRYEQQKNNKDGDDERGTLPLCPLCERCGVCSSVPSASTLSPSSSALPQQCEEGKSAVGTKRFLKDDAVLLAEALLQSHDDPAALALHSNKPLRWRCRWCTHEFTASMADRFLRYYRCPQCTGAVATPLNLLCIQRPDVLREVARNVSRSKLLKMTIHDNTVVTFVCRTCMSPYCMSVRLRCMLQRGATACPKCLWNRSQFAKEVAVANVQRGASTATPRLSMKNLRLKRRCRDTFDTVLNELRQRDPDLMN